MLGTITRDLMDLDRIISKVRNISEAAPTNNISGGDIKTFDKFLFPVSDDLLDQDYQTPGESGESIYRFSNVYTAERLTSSNIDSMVDASREYTGTMDDKRLENVMNMVRSLSLKEEAPTNSVAGGGIAGLPPDQPPVNLKKKKKRPPIIARGLMPGARKRWSNG